VFWHPVCLRSFKKQDKIYLNWKIFKIQFSLAKLALARILTIMNFPDDTDALLKRFDPLLRNLTFHELTLLNRFVVDRIKLMQKAGALVSMAQFRVGERVTWDGSDGIIRSGIIIRLNQKTASVLTGEGGYWTVSPQLLRKQEE